ncbi:hypothetical protein HZS_5736 [Henneguya salminicola]|nr:hypothetical protein HZS_5736 [Henneguya salminicola]
MKCESLIQNSHIAIILHACSLILMLPPLKNLKKKEVIQQPTECPNCHNSRIVHENEDGAVPKNNAEKNGPCLMKLFLISLANQ